jgi:hypothetical protein
MSKTEDANALSSLAHGLAAVAARLEAAQASALCGKAAATIIEAVSKTTDPIALSIVGQGGLAAVAARLEAAQAGATATAIIEAMSKTKAPFVLSRLAEGLAAMAARLEAAQVAATTAAIVQAMSKTTSANALSGLGQSLVGVAARLDASQAGATATAIVQAMSKTTDADALSGLGQGLAAVAARLEAAQAGALCGKAAPALVQAMTKPTDGDELPGLREGISALLCREKLDRTKGRFVAVASAAGCRAFASSGFLAIAQLEPAMQTVPPPLPAQVLVDLLEHPLCVGENRRAVLDQLSRHYNRPFADQWDFVEYARRQKLDLDLTSSLRRPE